MLSYKGQICNLDNLELRDKSTGKIIADALPVLARGKYISYEKWLLVNSDFLKLLASDKNLNLTDIRVLLGFASCVDFDNFSMTSQKQLAEQLDIAAPAINKSIKKLIDLGLIEKGERLDKTYVYSLNPFFAWCGRGKNLAKETHQLRKDKFFEESSSNFTDIKEYKKNMSKSSEEKQLV